MAPSTGLRAPSCATTNRGSNPSGCRGRSSSLPGEPVHEVREGVEAADAEDLLELRERVEVLRTRRAGGERGARRKVVDAETRLQVVEEKAHLGLGPDPHDPYSQPPVATAPADLVELGRKVGALEVVEVEGVDDALVRGGVLVHAEDQPRPARSSNAVRAELGQVIALGRVVGVVPVPDVDEVDFAWGQPAGPSDELGQWPGGGVGPRSRVDSAWPTWRRFGSGSCGPIGSTKSRSGTA